MHANLYAKGCIYLLPEVYCFITRHMAFYTYCQVYFKNVQLSTYNLTAFTGCYPGVAILRADLPNLFQHLHRVAHYINSCHNFVLKTLQRFGHSKSKSFII